MKQAVLIGPVQVYIEFVRKIMDDQRVAARQRIAHTCIHGEKDEIEKGEEREERER